MLKTAVAVLFLCLFAVFSIALKTELRCDKSTVETVKIGKPMPDFELPDSTGKTVKLSERHHSRSRRTKSAPSWINISKANR
jgi:hypothetical protein